MTRTLVTDGGRTLDPANHKLGDAVFVKVQLKNTSGNRVQNIALVDRIPAGWEIENPRLGRGGMPDWVDETLWEVEHMNLRDDRVEVFGALESGQTRTIVYQVRAVTSGSFAHPGVTVEAMYDPSVWARTARSTVRVKNPWGGS